MKAGSLKENRAHTIASVFMGSVFVMLWMIKLSRMQSLAIIAEKESGISSHSTQHRMTLWPITAQIKCTKSYTAGKVIDFPIEFQSDTLRTEVLTNRGQC